MRDGIAVFSDERCLYVNPAMLRDLGYESSAAFKVLGPKAWIQRHVAKDEQRAALSAMEAVRAGTTPAQTRQCQIVINDGRRLIIELSYDAISFDSAPALVITTRDVTEASLMRERLQRADKLASLGTLAAGIAHEINNPLAYVVANLGYAIQQLIGVRDSTPSNHSDESASRKDAFVSILEALEEAGEGADRVGRIVQGLKSFSRHNDDAQAPVNIARVLQTAIHMAENHIRYCARLEKNFMPVPAVEGNESLLVQVFVNLLVNAAQAITDGLPESNTISIRSFENPERKVVVEVSDTGTGIEPHQLARIFDPFFTTKPVGVGTGLGLAICHGLIHSMGGTITVESQPGKGSTFRIELLPAQPRDQSGQRLRSFHPAANQAKILIVDDEPMILRSMQRCLKVNHQVTGVTSAREALRLIQTGATFDVILCDLMMPDVTGMDFHTILQQNFPELAPRVVFVTGGAFTTKAEEYLELVQNPRLEKPVDPRALRRMMEQMTG